MGKIMHMGKSYTGGGSGATALTGLSDVSITNPADSQALVYNSITEKWENEVVKSGMPARFIMTSKAGSTITVTTPSSEVIVPTQVTGSTTQWECTTTEYGTHTINTTFDETSIQTLVNVDTCKEYNINILRSSITVMYPDDATSCTCTGNGETQTADSSPYTFIIQAVGTYTISVVYDGNTYTKSVVISESGQSESLFCPGPTDAPRNDIDWWLFYGQVDGTYNSLSQILAVPATVSALVSSDAAMEYLLWCDDWVNTICSNQTAMSYIGLSDSASSTLLARNLWVEGICNSTYMELVLTSKVPDMTSDTTPSGVASASSIYSAGYEAYKAFNGIAGNSDNAWNSASSHTTNEWVEYQFTEPVAVYKVLIANITDASNEYHPKDCIVQCYNTTSSEWDDALSFVNGPLAGASQTEILPAANTELTDAWRMFAVNKYGSVSYMYIAELQFWGRADVNVPTYTIQDWLHTAGIYDKMYTTIGEVLADTDTLSALISNHKSIMYLSLATIWAHEICNNSNAMSDIGSSDFSSELLIADVVWFKEITDSPYIESVFNSGVPAMTSTTEPYGELSSSGIRAGNPVLNAFDGDDNTHMSVANNGVTGLETYTDRWVQYEFTSPICVECLYLYEYYTSYPEGHSTEVKLCGSNDGSSFIDIQTFDTSENKEKKYLKVNNKNDYLYYRLYITKGYVYNTTMIDVAFYTIQFYGREGVTE